MAEPQHELGTNCKCVVDGNVLKIEIDLTQQHGETSTRKSYVVGSSHGWKGIDQDKSINLLVVRRK